MPLVFIFQIHKMDEIVFCGKHINIYVLCGLRIINKLSSPSCTSTHSRYKFSSKTAFMIITLLDVCTLITDSHENALHHTNPLTFKDISQ